MKSCTDLKQSKRLAKFLPHESADLWWAERYAGRMENWEYIVEEKPVYYLSFTKPSENNCSQDTIKDIPSWSLAALLAVLDEPYLLKKFHTWSCYVFNPNNHRFISTDSAEPVDACVDMVIKLHEQKLL